jgi:hypothetical protein
MGAVPTLLPLPLRGDPTGLSEDGRASDGTHSGQPDNEQSHLATRLPLLGARVSGTRSPPRLVIEPDVAGIERRGRRRGDESRPTVQVAPADRREPQADAYQDYGEGDYPDDATCHHSSNKRDQQFT